MKLLEKDNMHHNKSALNGGILFMDERYVYMPAKCGEVMVDIVMETYNHENYLRQALDSIFAQQTQFSYKVIVGEDCSKDHTKDILLEYFDKYPGKMELILWKKNVGTLENDYEIMGRCRAKYVATLEGDDYWTDKLKLEKQVSFLEEHSEYIAVCHNVRCVNEVGKLLHRDFRFFPITEEHIYGRKHAGMAQLAGQSAALILRNIFKQWSEKEWDCYKAAKVNGDMKIQAVLGMAGNIYCSREIMSDYRRTFTGDSWTASVRWDNRLWDSYKAIYELEKYLYAMGYGTDDMDAFVKSVLKNALAGSIQKLLCEWNIRNLNVWWKLLCEWVKKNGCKGR